MNFKWLEDWFEKIEPKGKWSWLGSTYEAFHTFAFTPKTVTRAGSHIRDAVDMKRSIIIVVIALVPPCFSACGTSATRPTLPTPPISISNFQFSIVGGSVSCACFPSSW